MVAYPLINGPSNCSELCFTQCFTWYQMGVISCYQMLYTMLQFITKCFTIQKCYSSHLVCHPGCLRGRNGWIKPPASALELLNGYKPIVVTIKLLEYPGERFLLDRGESGKLGSGHVGFSKERSLFVGCCRRLRNLGYWDTRSQERSRKQTIV